MKGFNRSKREFPRIALVIYLVFNMAGSVRADFTFGERTNLGPTINTMRDERSPCSSADGLVLYFSTNHEGGYGSDDLWVSARPTTDDVWGPAQNLGPVVNSSKGEGHPAISADGLELYFERWKRRPDTTLIYGIWVTKRISKGDAWSILEKVELAVPDGYMAMNPSLSTDGLELYFAAANPVEAKSDLYVTRRKTKDSPWTECVSLGPVVNNGNGQVGPRISADGLVLLSHDWQECSPRPGGLGLGDIWLTRRATTDSEWQAPVNVGRPINNKGRDTGAVISPDGSTLYFSVIHVGGSGWYDLWQAPLFPVVDFDGDRRIGIGDLVLMVDAWGTDHPRYDIGPMPWGDGVVDAVDLNVLMDSWGQEVDFPYDPRKASNPIPSDGSTMDVDELSSLSWRPGRNIAQHDVYFGADSVAVEDADISDPSGMYRGRQEAIDYTPPDELEFGRTFFWRVDEVNPEGTIVKGRLWSFTIADFVEDFEDYNDDIDAGTTIWHTWRDGWGDPDNGSQVGYLMTPFAEQIIVHGGSQAMPFFYDNSFLLVMSSEATRVWGEPQDWTKRGVKRLTLWIRGLANNDPEPPYVALRDSSGSRATVMHTDPTLTTAEDWQQWSIDLAAFIGVNLDSITWMTFGVGDKSDMQRGGTGRVFVDDIALHLPATQ